MSSRATCNLSAIGLLSSTDASSWAAYASCPRGASKRRPLARPAQPTPSRTPDLAAARPPHAQAANPIRGARDDLDHVLAGLWPPDDDRPEPMPAPARHPASVDV